MGVRPAVLPPPSSNDPGGGPGQGLGYAGRRGPSPLVYACFDALLLSISWVGVYIWRYGERPSLSAGPFVLILAWLLIHFLLGTYTALSRRQLCSGAIGAVR